MNKQEAEEYAKEMTYRDAVYNALQGKCIPYRKATLIKLYELLDMVEPKTEKVIKMRDATPEERESIDKYIKSISKPTGVDFWSLEQEPCEDAISREKAKQFLYERLDRLNDDELYDIFSRIIDDMYNELPSVKQEPKTIQEKQAESEKYQKAFDDGYENGYAQARFDYEQNPCGDVISRQAVLEYIEGSEAELGHSSENELVCQDIKELPPVKPQEKTGHWIRGHHGFGCSNCHKSIEGEWDDDIDDITGTLFCPNCGARMIELKESEKINCKSTKCENCINHNYCDYEPQKERNK